MSPAELLGAFRDMTLRELSDFRKAFEEAFDVTAEALAPAPAMLPVPAEEAEPETPEYADVIIEDYGPAKIQVIKIVRTVRKLGLREAKDLVEKVPATVGEEMAPDDARAFAGELTAAGARVTVR